MNTNQLAAMFFNHFMSDQNEYEGGADDHDLAKRSFHEEMVSLDSRIVLNLSVYVGYRAA